MRNRLTMLVGVVMFAAACASTDMTSTWKNPTFTGPKPQKVLVVALVPNQSIQGQLEGQLASRLMQDHIQAGALSQLVPDETHVTPTALQQILRDGNYDGMLVARFKSVTQHVEVTPSSYGYGYGWGGYWGAYGPGGPGYVDVTPHTQMEASLFDAKTNGQLIWSGSSTTVPSGSGSSISNKDIEKYAQVVVDTLHKQVG